jgi:chromosome segregation ATPase
MAGAPVHTLKCSVSLEKICLKKVLQVRENRLKIQVQQIKDDINSSQKVAEDKNQQYEELRKALVKSDLELQNAKTKFDTFNRERSTLISQIDEESKNYGEMFGVILRAHVEDKITVVESIKLQCGMNDSFIRCLDAKKKFKLYLKEKDEQIANLQGTLDNMSTENVILQTQVENVARVKKRFQHQSEKSQNSIRQVEQNMREIQEKIQNLSKVDVRGASHSSQEKIQIDSNDAHPILHKCNFAGCGQSFEKKKSRDSHQKRHYNDFVCEFCSQSFNQKDSLMKHMRCHTGHKPFSCPICDRKFTQKYNMKLHCKKVHQTESNTK